MILKKVSQETVSLREFTFFKTMAYRRMILFFLLPAIVLGNSSPPVFTMCVPEKFWEECIDMMHDSANQKIPISCISGRDRYECIEKVGRKEADVVAVDPEDMYLAANNEFARQSGYSVVEQVRTKEEPDAAHRYEAVAVIHKDLNISNVQGLRGLKSCHTGVGRNVGYKIPITKLTAMGVLGNINHPEYSARENEIRALSSLFSKGCLVGKWSQDPAINSRLKETYSNMCALCEKPELCDYPDIYSGYEGALRCLAHNGGEVAWTKVIYVRRFFGLPVGVSAALPTTENPTNFRYFCPDGSKVPIDADTKPCTWAARPWQGYMTNNNVKNIEAIQKELTSLGELGEKENAAWWKDLMLLDEKTKAVAAQPVAPEEHLKKAKYLDVIERNSGAPERDARWCVWNQESLIKCNAFSKAAFSRDARPRITCQMEKTMEDCIKVVRDDGADLVVLDGPFVSNAMKNFNLKPIMSETYGPGSTMFGERPAVAVIRKGTPINGLGDLRGKSSCHKGYKPDFAGWEAPVRALKKAGLIQSENDVATFFGGSCVPGAPIESKLCQQCVGNMGSGNDKTKESTRCMNTKAETFRGGMGALKCLKANKGEVAFVPLTAVMHMIKTNKTEDMMKKSDLMLVCPEGGIATVDDWEKCNLGMEPPRIVLSSSTKSINALEELKHGVLAATVIYGKRPDLLKLFGSWETKSDLIFKDDAMNLMSIDDSWNKWATWETMMH